MARPPSGRNPLSPSRRVRWVGAFDRESAALGMPVLEPAHKAALYRAEVGGDTYSHHGYIESHLGTLFASWSNHACDEDASGQHVRFTHSHDRGATWRPAAQLFPPLDHVKPRAEQDAARDRVLIANGFAFAQGDLYAVAEAHMLGNPVELTPPPNVPAAQDAERCAFTSRPGIGRLARSVSPDGELGPIFWLVDPAPGPVPGFPDYPAASDPAFAATASALNAWLARPEHWPSWEFLRHTCHVWAADGHYLCEPTQAWVLPDGGLARIWRDLSKGSGSQYAQFSDDGGGTWQIPIRAAFPDAYSRTAAGNLPDGTAYLINNPGTVRDPLVISLAADGLNFDRHAIFAHKAPPRRFEGVAKGKGFSYPRAVVAEGHLFAIYSVNKEDIEAAAFPLEDLQRTAVG